MPYKYRLKNFFFSYERQTGVLKKRFADQIHSGWPNISFSREENKALAKSLEKQLPVARYRVDADAYRDFVTEINYREKYPNYYPANFYEKTLEHFLAFRFLELKQGDKFVDIAAENSPHSVEFSRLTGCTGYRQDIMYKPGIHGLRIGGDAAHLPVADNFFQAALAACSIEHFEQDSDIRFMKEMSRVLSPGGKIVIIPLYLHNTPFCVTDPRHSVTGRVQFDAGIDIHCVKEFANRHGRFYSPHTLYRRLVEPNRDTMEFTVQYIENFKDIDDSLYCRFALVGEKKEKKRKNR